MESGRTLHQRAMSALTEAYKAGINITQDLYRKICGDSGESES